MDPYGLCTLVITTALNTSIEWHWHLEERDGEECAVGVQREPYRMVQTCCRAAVTAFSTNAYLLLFVMMGTVLGFLILCWCFSYCCKPKSEKIEPHEES